jgi:hypothetical protein
MEACKVAGLNMPGQVAILDVDECGGYQKIYERTGRTSVVSGIIRLDVWRHTAA